MAGCHGHPHVTVQSYQPMVREWEMSREMQNADTVCLPLEPEDRGYRACRTVGELKAFMRSLRAHAGSDGPYGPLGSSDRPPMPVVGVGRTAVSVYTPTP